MDGFVYKLKNKINGMYYIGSHKGDINSKYIGSGLVFRSAMKKYGICNFEREILYIGENYREEEKNILTNLNAALDKNSYNLKNEALGGTFFKERNGMFKKHHSEETKILISKHSNMKTPAGKLKHSKIMAGKGNPMFGKNHDEFTKQKIRNTMKAKKENWSFLNTPKHHRSIFYNIYAKLRRFGSEISPRNQKTIEIENFNMVFPPYVRFCNFESRKLKIDYIKRETLWYLRANKYDLSIIEHAKMWENFVDEGGIIHSNYGQYIWGEQNQFDRVVKTLIEDKDSRRAIITILQPYHTEKEKLVDVPCTYGLSFRIRENELKMTVKMRSQDSYFGLASDIPIFSFIHEMIYINLKEVYPDLIYGEYHHFVESFHIYEKHFNFLYNLKKSSRYSLILCPKISSKAEVDFLRKLDYSNIPEQYKFTKWLTTYDRDTTQTTVSKYGI